MLDPKAYEARGVILTQKLDQMIGEMVRAGGKLLKRCVKTGAQRIPAAPRADLDVLHIKGDDHIQIARVNRQC
jgi:hypothetical protein